MVVFRFFLFFIFSSTLLADNYYVRVAHGKSTESDYGQIFFGHIEGSLGNAQVYALDGGYLLAEDIYDLPIDLYLSAGTAYFYEGSLGKNVYEATLYIKAYYKWSWLGSKFRFGFGEGGSYTSSILYAEKASALKRGDNTSNYLNYLDTSLDVDLGSLVGSKSLENIMMGVAIKHRSGVFGLVNNAKKNGSNYNCFYIEVKF